MIRSTLFNILFYGLNALACIAFLPLLAMPRHFFIRFVEYYVGAVDALERSVLGLRFEIQGHENLPSSGAYLVAAKHQSQYETFKLHRLFRDPAIVLKRELLSIPLWGAYLKRIDPIAIDRGAGKSAMEQIIDGARRVRDQGRPIVIFPQGTRVRPGLTPADKPYKAGIARMQEATGLPIVPMALNSGVFWPKGSWIKKPGTVVFRFLPPIEPGRPIAETMKALEDSLEGASNDLLKDAAR